MVHGKIFVPLADGVPQDGSLEGFGVDQRIRLDAILGGQDVARFVMSPIAVEQNGDARLDHRNGPPSRPGCTTNVNPRSRFGHLAISPRTINFHFTALWGD